MSEIEAKNVAAGKQTEEETSKVGKSSADALRRDFIKRFGAYAAGSALGMYVLMSAKDSAIAGSDGAP